MNFHFVKFDKFLHKILLIDYKESIDFFYYMYYNMQCGGKIHPKFIKVVKILKINYDLEGVKI